MNNGDIAIQMQKYRADIAAGIRNIAFQGMMDQRGSIFGTSKIFGYVCAIHGNDDENEKLRGTIDVQEYNYDENEDEKGAGFHEGVLISAIQNNKSGYRLIPELYSDVVIVQEPSSLEEYVLMYSHVKVVQLKACSKVEVGVVGHEDFKETDDGLEKDYNELDENGNSSLSTYTENKITHKVSSKNSSSYIDITPNSVNLNGNDASAVKYEELAGFLQKLCSYLANGIVPTQGSPLDTAPQIGAMASEIEKMMSKKVKLG